MSRRVPGRRAWTTHRPGSRRARAIRASHRAGPPSRPRSTPAPLDPTFGLIRRRSRARRTNSGRSTRRPATSSVRRAPSTRVHGTDRRSSRRSAGVKRRASSGRPMHSRSPFWLNSPATPGRTAPASKRSRKPAERPPRRAPDVLETEVAVDDVDGHVAEAHAPPHPAEIRRRALLGRDAGRAERRDEARDLAVAVDGTGVLHERDPAQAPPPEASGGRLYPAHHEGQEIGRIDESTRLPGGVHAGKDLRPQDPDAGRVIVESRETRGVGLEEHWLERAVRSRLEAHVGADHELPGRGRARRVPRDPRCGRLAHRAQPAEAADVGPPEGRRVDLDTVDEVGEPREAGQRPAAHEERREGDRVRHGLRAGAVAMEERGRRPRPPPPPGTARAAGGKRAA